MSSTVTIYDILIQNTGATEAKTGRKITASERLPTIPSPE
ncbi:MAG: hypothetical protein ACI86M_003146 [Saprospiraceae bacterium]|jgi:hypothetical protein